MVRRSRSFASVPQRNYSVYGAEQQQRKRQGDVE